MKGPTRKPGEALAPTREIAAEAPREHLLTDEEVARFKKIYERDGLTAALAREFNNLAIARGLYRMPGSFRLTPEAHASLAEFFPKGSERELALAKVELLIDTYRRAANRKPDKTGTRRTEESLAKNLRDTAEAAANLVRCLDTLVDQDRLNLPALLPGLSAEVIFHFRDALEVLHLECRSDAEWLSAVMKSEGARRPARYAEKALVDVLIGVFEEHGTQQRRGVTKRRIEFVQAALRQAGVEIGHEALVFCVKRAITRWNRGPLRRELIHQELGL